VFAAARARQDAQATREREAAAATAQEAARAAATPSDGDQDVTAPRPRVALEGPPALAPAVLTEDLAAAHAAVAAVAAQQSTRPTTSDARSDRAEAQVSGVRREAQSKAAQATVHFEEHEEQFFQQGSSPSYGHPQEPVENFDDLDRGYQPQTFWERLLGKKKPPPTGKR
jgi:hypothetical protein